MQAADFLRDKRAMPAVNVVIAVTEAIRQAKRIPSGHLYVMLMDLAGGMIDLPAYENMLAMLKRTGLVAETAAHELVWTGPELTA